MFKDIQATIDIDLSKSEEDLFKQVDKDAKWGIKKAEKDNISVVLTKSEEDLKRFYDIYKKTIIIGGIVPDNIEELKKGNYRLFIAKKDDQVIAGAIIEILDEKVRLKYNASLQNFLKFQPNNLIYWTLIKWGKREGFKIFDLGGYQLKAHGHLTGINRFKERWGGQVKIYYIKSWNPIYILGRKVIRNIPLVKKIKDWLKLKIYLTRESYRRNSIGKKGLFNFLKQIFKKIMFDKNEIIIYSALLDSEQNIKQPKIKSKLIEITDLTKYENLGFDKEVGEDRLLNGDRLFAITAEDRVLHSSWLKFREMDIREVAYNIKIENGEACIYDSYTDENFRGKGLYPSMLSFFKKYLKDKGLKKAYIYVESSNKPSIAGIEKAGFIKETLIRYLRLFGFKFKKIVNLKDEEK